MRTLRRPEQNQSKAIRPENPFNVYISWNSGEGKWRVSNNGEKREAKGPIRFLVIDYLHTIKGGVMNHTDVFSFPFYRYTSKPVDVWEKNLASGQIAKIGSGPVNQIYDDLKAKAKASKAVQLFGYLPQTGQLAILELSGYALSPFYNHDQDLAESPGIVLPPEGQQFPDPYKKDAIRYSPIFVTDNEIKAEEITAALKDFEGQAETYVSYLEGEEKTEATKKEEGPAEEKQSKNSAEPW